MYVAVLRGGPGEYELSLASGQHVINHLRARHNVSDIYVDREGLWHRSGLVYSPERALGQCDVVVNCLHGDYAESGHVQGLLDAHSYRYSGSGRVPSALAYNKQLAKTLFARAGLAVPLGYMVDTQSDPYEVADRLIREVGGQFIIKPVQGSMSRGVRVARSYQELAPLIIEGLWESGKVIVEEVVRGREAKVGVVDGLRGDSYYTLLPIEISKAGDLSIYIPHGGNNFRIPGRFSQGEKEQLQYTAREAHKAIGAEGYSMVDIVLTSRGPVVLELDTHPSLGNGHPMQVGLEALGVSQPEFLEHLLITA